MTQSALWDFAYAQEKFEAMDAPPEQPWWVEVVDLTVRYRHTELGAMVEGGAFDEWSIDFARLMWFRSAEFCADRLLTMDVWRRAWPEMLLCLRPLAGIVRFLDETLNPMGWSLTVQPFKIMDERIPKALRTASDAARDTDDFYLNELRQPAADMPIPPTNLSQPTNRSPGK